MLAADDVGEVAGEIRAAVPAAKRFLHTTAGPIDAGQAEFRPRLRPFVDLHEQSTPPGDELARTVCDGRVEIHFP